ncbi:ATP-binding protein [Candidatus Dependentiae bacterium]|nr:ATP-binding protein [Candidatus Dependentiae bacterium]
MFNRPHYLDEIMRIFRMHSVCGLLGPRQVGKTTLARAFVTQHLPGQARVFDLEDSTDLALFQEPKQLLEQEPEKLIVIDEVQMRPELFPTLRVLVDKPDHKRKVLILGSASRDFIKQSSETLAGRIGYIELPPFSLVETKDIYKLWLRGGFPLAHTALTEKDSLLWRRNYISSYLQRDLPALGFDIPPAQLQRFWLMLAHYHGNIFNASEIAKSLGISGHTVRRYLDILAGTFMVRILLPWFENISKRQVKSPKIYFRDSGILHALMSIPTMDALYAHPKFGSFWEGFALEETIRSLGVTAEECFFWATQADAELDLLVFKDGKRLGFEFKYTDSPKITKSMHIALADLKLDHLTVVYPGTKSFKLAENITVRGLLE